MLFIDAEIAEANYPMRYDQRTERVDSGGPGQYRGGTGGQFEFTVTSSSVVCTGLEFAATSGAAFGAAGGSPGMLGATLLRRDGQAAVGIRGDLRTQRGDRIVEATVGGGGIGDPLDRDPQAVCADVAEGVVSRSAASGTYGVIVTPGGAAADGPATAARRREIRRQRIGTDDVAEPVAEVPGRRVSRSLSLLDRDGEECVLLCRRCGHELGPAAVNIKDRLAVDERSVVDTNPDAVFYAPRWPFVTRTFCCPHCAALIDVERNVEGAPYVWSIDMSDGWRTA
jgi:N-methylhydantoinase B